MIPDKITIAPGTWIVFEGMDGTGKTTQMERIQAHAGSMFEEPQPFFTHQPSGGTSVGNLVYQITEQVQGMHSLTRQFLHLASHTDHYHYVIGHELQQRAVFQDRCFVSTLAYGLLQPPLSQLLGAAQAWDLATLPVRSTINRLPNVVFLFMEPYVDDDHNTEELERAYDKLPGILSAQGVPVLYVPSGTYGEVTSFIFTSLADMDLADVTWKDDPEGEPS